MHDAKKAFDYVDGRLVLTRPGELSEEDWAGIAGAFRKLGYRNSSPLQAMRTFTGLCAGNQDEGRPGYALRPDQQAAAEILFYGRPDGFDAALSAKTERRAVKTFGITHDPELAGYLTPSGRMLNFSYEGRQRDIDHREVTELFDDEDQPENEPGGNCAAMLKLMDLGFIRLTTAGIDMIRRPTDAQYRELSRFCAYYRGQQIFVEITTPTSGTAASRLFPMGTSPAVIRAETDTFHDTGYFPGEYDGQVSHDGFLAAAGRSPADPT